MCPELVVSKIASKSTPNTNKLSTTPAILEILSCLCTVPVRSTSKLRHRPALWSLPGLLTSPPLLTLVCLTDLGPIFIQHAERLQISNAPRKQNELFPPMAREGEIRQCISICYSICSLGRDHVYASSNINEMYVLDSTRQKLIFFRRQTRFCFDVCYWYKKSKSFGQKVVYLSQFTNEKICFASSRSNPRNKQHSNRRCLLLGNLK